MNDSILSSTSWGKGLLAVLEILLVTVTFALGAKTALVRDSDPGQPDFTKRPFSLAKSQLAFWSVVVIGSFIYLYLDAEKFSGVMNNTALWLLGISSGTTALSAAAVGTAPAAGSPVQAHQSFFSDILSDSQGMNVHRLQMLIWTFVFGGVFISETIRKGAFPTFDEQAYVLMGISSATYVWFKRNET